MVMGAVEYRPDDYLIKPFTRDVLKTRLERAFGRKSDFELIEKAIAAKEYLKAIRLCDQYVQKIPKNIFEYMKLKGELCITIGDFQTAKTVYEKILSIREIPWAKLGMGKVLYYTENYEAAAETFRALTAENSMYVEAYDWLSKTYIATNSHEDAQQALVIASEISPKSVMRHKTIGEISYRLNDLDTSERSYKKAISLGQHSYFRSPSFYTGLAKVLVDKKEPDTALNVIRDIRNAFQNDTNASMHASAMETIVYRDMNRTEEAKKSMQDAMMMLDASTEKMPENIAIDLAKACFDLGDKAAGTRIVQQVVRNNHEDEEIINRVKDIFANTHMESEGSQIIAAAQKETIQINNKGVRLVDEGRLEEAIEYFEKAAASLNGNKIINANAAQALIMFMQKNGKDDALIGRARKYIEQVASIDLSYSRYQKLLGMFENLAGG
jgi:tetratricopeptide (TPR) repeat protein